MNIGIDLGGTNIAAGLVDDNYKLVDKISTPTGRERHYSEIVKDMAKLCDELVEKNGLKKEDIKKIGIGSPGTIDCKNGVVVYSNNIRWDNVPLADELKKYYNIPISVANDANAAAFGEYLVNGEGSDNFVAITLGTGVGSGYIFKQQVFTGSNGAAMEAGHIPLIFGGVQCTCGNEGCWETYASVTGLIRQTKEAIAKHPDSVMAKAEKVSGKTAFAAAKEGDEAGLKVVDTYIDYVAAGVAALINIFAPEVFVIGGGISNEGDYLLNPLKEKVKKYTYCKAFGLPKIKIATLKNDAGIIGAAFI